MCSLSFRKETFDVSLEHVGWLQGNTDCIACAWSQHQDCNVRAAEPDTPLVHIITHLTLFSFIKQVFRFRYENKNLTDNPVMPLVHSLLYPNWVELIFKAALPQSFSLTFLILLNFWYTCTWQCTRNHNTRRNSPPHTCNFSFRFKGNGFPLILKYPQFPSVILLFVILCVWLHGIREEREYWLNTVRARVRSSVRVDTGLCHRK